MTFGIIPKFRKYVLLCFGSKDLSEIGENTYHNRSQSGNEFRFYLVFMLYARVCVAVLMQKCRIPQRWGSDQKQNNSGSMLTF